MKIKNMLKELGIPANLYGYTYIRTGVTMILQDPSKIHRLTKDLYPAIAKEHGSTTTRVERAIRHAVETCFDRADPETLQNYFGNCAKFSKGKVTNGEFLATLAERLRDGEV